MKLAKKGEKFLDLPNVVKGMDVSFSGILSYIETTAEERLKNNECTPADFATPYRKLCLLCLWRLRNGQWRTVTRKMFSLLVVWAAKPAMSACKIQRTMCSERGGNLFATDGRYCIDNGAMIAYTGLLADAHGTSTPMEESTFTQRFRTDEVLAIWREKESSHKNGIMEEVS